MSLMAAAKTSAGRRADPIRVMIVDDHPMWRDTLRQVLELRRFADVVAEADDGRASVELAGDVNPDVVVMDVALPLMSGIEATARLVTARPDQRVLVLASSDDRDQVVSAVRAGASGYLIKTVRPKELREAVRRVHEGELVFPPAVSGAVLAELRGGGPSVAAPSTQVAASLQQEGEYWTVTYGTSVFRLKDQKGLAYLAALIRHPGRELHSLELITLGSGDAPARRRDEGQVHAGGSVDEILDPAARKTIREHIGALEQELAEAKGWGDAERAERLEREIENVTRQLSAAVGLGGRSRAFTTAAERARVNITRSIKAALERIRANCPPLAEHLSETVRTGTYCSYLPGSDAPAWHH
jgi:DNA-binding NarL/FixJ family response regulator